MFFFTYILSNYLNNCHLTDKTRLLCLFLSILLKIPFPDYLCSMHVTHWSLEIIELLLKIEQIICLAVNHKVSPARFNKPLTMIISDQSLTKSCFWRGDRNYNIRIMGPHFKGMKLDCISTLHVSTPNHLRASQIVNFHHTPRLTSNWSSFSTSHFLFSTQLTKIHWALHGKNQIHVFTSGPTQDQCP